MKTREPKTKATRNKGRLSGKRPFGRKDQAKILKKSLAAWVGVTNRYCDLRLGNSLEVLESSRRYGLYTLLTADEEIAL